MGGRITVFIIVAVIALIIPGGSCLAQQGAEGVSLRMLADTIKYENAIQFFQMREYGKALREFNEYLEIYINGTHRNDAYRHIARIYFDRFEYEQSIRAYTVIYEESSNTEEGVDAYYRTGICYQKMGDDARAREVYRAIIDQYPYSDYASQARIQMNLMKIIEK